MYPAADPGIDVVRRRARDLGCPLWEFAESSLLDTRTFAELLRLCQERRVAIWHGHDYKSNALGLLLRRRWPMSLLTTVHGWTWDTWRSRLYYRLDNWCLRRYDHVIAVSPRHVAHCRKLGIPDHRVTYVPNGVDLTETRDRPDRDAIHRDLNLPSGRFVIGVVGRLSAEKAVDRAIRTLAALRRLNESVELHLIGDGPKRGELQMLARRLGVSRWVRFGGWQTDQARFYGAMDLLLLPSRTEGSPNVVLEAMANRIPVAATDVGNVRQMLDDGRCGVMLNQHPESWPDRIAPLLSNPQRRAELGHLGRRRVEQHYSFRRRMEKVLAIYDRLLIDHGEANAEPLRRAA